jgi:hypothetical protein
MSNETKKKEDRIWVKAFGKYLDELSVEEWEEMANSSCGLPDKPGAKEPGTTGSTCDENSGC